MASSPGISVSKPCSSRPRRASSSLTRTRAKSTSASSAALSSAGICQPTMCRPPCCARGMRLRRYRRLTRVSAGGTLTPSPTWVAETRPRSRAAVPRSSQFSIAPDTYGPTIRSFSAGHDQQRRGVRPAGPVALGRRRQPARDFVQTGRHTAGGRRRAATGPGPQHAAGIWMPPSSSSICVSTPPSTQNATGTALCNLARKYVIDYQNALPVSATGPDVANRLGEQKARVETFLHVFDTYSGLPSSRPVTAENGLRSAVLHTGTVQRSERSETSKSPCCGGWPRPAPQQASRGHRVRSS